MVGWVTFLLLLLVELLVLLATGLLNDLLGLIREGLVLTSFDIKRDTNLFVNTSLSPLIFKLI